jgi:predicted RNase H-like HicB family nuclease
VIIQLPVSVIEEGNIYIASCPVFHLTSRGETLEKAIENIKTDLETFLDNEKVQKEYYEVIEDYGISDIEIVDIVVRMK